LSRNNALTVFIRYIFLSPLHPEVSGIMYFLFLTDVSFATLYLSLVKVIRNYLGTKEKQT